MTLYAIHFMDKREREHVVALTATTKAEALEKVIGFQDAGEDGWYNNGFYFTPVEENVVEIDPGNDVQVLFHEDYD